MNNKLMYVEVPIVHLDVCYSAYLPEDIFIDENKICAGVPGKDSCQVTLTVLDFLICS